MQFFSSMFRAMPGSLPTGVSQFAVKSIDITRSTSGQLDFVKLVKFGSLNLATPTYTDNNAAPTVTEAAVSRQRASAILAVVNTGLNATPGSISMTYTDEGGGSQASASTALTASALAGTCGFVPLTSPDTGAVDITAGTRTGGTTPTGVIDFYHCTPIGKSAAVRVVGNVYRINNITGDGILCTLGVNEQIGVIGSGNTASAVQGFITYVGLA